MALIAVSSAISQDGNPTDPNVVGGAVVAEKEKLIHVHRLIETETDGLVGCEFVVEGQLLLVLLVKSLLDQVPEHCWEVFQLAFQVHIKQQLHTELAPMELLYLMQEVFRRLVHQRVFQNLQDERYEVIRKITDYVVVYVLHLEI